MLNINIYEREDGGVPGTNFLFDLREKVDSCSFTITDKFGFESMTCPLTTTVDDALDWLINGLGRAVILSSPDGDVCWEGRLITVEAVFGQETRSVSLEGMANRVRVRYTTVLGTPGSTAQSSNTASQALYGVKDAVVSIGASDSTEAGYLRAVELARLANPRMRPITSVATGDQGQVALTLIFEGWYGALGDLTTSDSSTTKTQTTTQVGTLLTAYNAVNNYFSTSTANITASGITAMEFISDDTTYRAKIEALMKHGNGTQPYAWGVYEDREFHAGPWAGATPTTITYRRYLGESDIYGSGGVIIPPWLVRPNSMYEVVDLLDVGTVASAQDAPARFYVARTVCTIEGSQVTVALEPAEPFDFTAIFVRKY